MTKKYKAKVGFHNPKTGRVEVGDIIEDSFEARDLCRAGYIREYKTKVIVEKPKVIKTKIVNSEGVDDKIEVGPEEDKPKKKVKKKTSKKTSKK